MIEINGIVWGLYFVPPFDPSLQRRDGSYTIGMCDSNPKRIYICEGLSETLTKKVLCHELVHASMYSYQVSLSEDQEELVAQILSTYGEEIVEKTNVIFHRLIL